MNRNHMPLQRNPPPFCINPDGTHSPVQTRCEPTQASTAAAALKCVVALNSEPFRLAIASLEHAFQFSPEVVQRFLSGIDSASQLVCIHSGHSSASGAGEVRVSLEPTDLLADFLATFSAGNIK
jgi:hypothetical protein